MRLHSRSRRAAALVEFAVVGSVACLLLFGLLVGGLGIFRYLQVASLARESSRWACVRGTQYQADTGNAAATATDVYNNVIKPEAVALDLSKLTYSVTWNTNNSPYHTTIVNNQLVGVSNTVTVTINYQWVPELFFGGVTVKSTSVSVMAN
jgi:Flp pilus assembly protein TadG